MKTALAYKAKYTAKMLQSSLIEDVIRAWYGMENGMERKFRYGVWKMPEWNGMEDFKNGIEDNFRTSISILY